MSSDANQRGLTTRTMAICVLGGALAALLTFVSVWLRATPIRLALPPAAEAQPPEPSRDVLRAAFFDSEVEPRIAATDALNREAARRCVERLRGVMAGYRFRVQPFVEDLTSISTRLGIVQRMPADWWKKDGRVEAYVQEKFETHLFSQQKLTQDVAAILDDFRDEIDANQKRMLVEISASLSTSDLPEISVDQYEPFFEAVAAQLRDYSTRQGTNSVYSALTILVVSEAGSFAAVSVAAGLLARFGTAAATGAVAAGGVTAGATATGAGGGSLAGPVGTAVGFGVGLVIGLTIDWWMTERFEEELNQQLNAYLISLEESILHGSAAGKGCSPAPTRAGGIAQAVPDVCDQLKCAYRERFYQKIVSMEP